MRAVKFYLSFLLLSSALCRADTLLVLGDSLSAAYRIDTDSGWVTLLAAELREHQVHNASVSGETTGGALNRLPRLLEELDPDWVLIELGGNDGLRGYPLQSIRANLSAMIETTQATGARPILMEIMIPPNYGERYSNALTAIFSDLASQYQVPLIPFILTDIALQPELMQDDGIHPTAEAQPLVTNLVLDQLRPLLEGDIEATATSDR